MENKEVISFMDMNYQNAWENALYNLIKYEFPDIKNLKVEASEMNTVSLSFDEGTYTKEEVENKINEVRNSFKGKFKTYKDE